MLLFFVSLPLLHLLAKQVEPGADNVLQLQLGGIDKLAEGEILGSYLIDAQSLHLVDIEGDDRLDQLFGIESIGTPCHTRWRR